LWIYRADTLYFSVDWIDMDQNGTNWRAVVSTEMKALVQQNAGNFLIN